jgi:hypothetical protein
MIKFSGFLIGISIIIFLLQPWVEEHYPDFYCQGKSIADESIALVSAHVEEVARSQNISPPIPTEPISVDTAVVPETGLNEPSIIITDVAVKPAEHKEELARGLISIPATEVQITFPLTAIRQSIWAPFTYETSARAFARQITEKTSLAVSVEKTPAGQYQLVLESSDRNSMQSDIMRIEQALGLTFNLD